MQNHDAKNKKQKQHRGLDSDPIGAFRKESTQKDAQMMEADASPTYLINQRPQAYAGHTQGGQKLKQRRVSKNQNTAPIATHSKEDK